MTCVVVKSYFMWPNCMIWAVEQGQTVVLLESLVCMVVKREDREGILFENSISSEM